MHNLDNNAHSVFLLHYHLIMVVKYRRKVINDPISERAKEIWEYINQFGEFNNYINQPVARYKNELYFGYIYIFIIK